MKILRKTLSLLLTVYMVMGMVCISYADEVTLPDKLLNLDISQYSKVTTGTNGEDLADSGIKNTGTSTTANIDWISNDYQVTVKSSFENANNEITEYLDFTMTAKDWTDKCWRRVVKDNIWETQANTISFWVDIGEHASYRNFLSYHAQYTDSYVRLGLWQTPNNLWNTDSNEINAIEVSKYSGWKHVVITNPLYNEETSKKTMDIYVNGVKKKSIEITKPSGDLEFAGLYFAGAPYPTSVTTASMPLNCKYGNVAVYDGKLSDAQIEKLYEDEKNLYTEAVPELLFDMDISAFNPDSNTKDRGIRNTVLGSQTEVELCNGVRTIDNNTVNSGVFNRGTYTNIKSEAIPYVELYTSQYTTNNSSTPATARLFVDSADWTGRSYTTEFWIKSAKPSHEQYLDFYAPLLGLYGGLDTTDRNINGGSLVTGNGTCDGTTDYVKFSRTNSEKWYLGTNDKASKTQADPGWMHLTITRKVDSSKTKAIHEGYINGVKVFTAADNIRGTSSANTATSLATKGSSGVVIGKLTASGSHQVNCVNSSVCVADVKVYSTVLEAEDILNHYNTELPSYTPAEINISFTDSKGNGITTLDTVDTTDEAVVTMNYTENVVSDDIWMVAGCYDADGNLLDYEEVTDIAAGTLNITVPKDTDSIKVFTWKKSIYMPLSTRAIISKTPVETE